jgi:hypothetical protein
MQHSSFVRALGAWSVAFAVGAIACGGQSSAALAADAGDGVRDGIVVVDSAADTASIVDTSTPVDTAASIDAPSDVAHEAAVEAGPCALGAVDFELHVTSGTWSTAEPSGDVGCNWVNVTSTKYAGVILNAEFPRDPTAFDCATCARDWIVPIGCVSGIDNLGAAGLSQRWSGQALLPGTCGPSSTQCSAQSCVPAGHYVARMCGCPPGDGGGSDCANPTCVDVPFDYPTSAPVVGVLSP